jgi:acetyl-CoA carboxylase carboxyltransferase component
MPDTKKWTADEIFDALFDTGSQNEISEGYGNAAVAYGYIKGSPAVGFVLDGVMDSATSVKICKALDFAVQNGTPVVGIYNSKGAYTTDGAAVFGYYGSILKKTAQLSGVVPQIGIAYGVCSGSLAVIAAASDILIATDSAEIYSSVGGVKDADKGAVAIRTADIKAAIDTAAALIEKLPSNNLAPIPEFEADVPGALPEGSGADVIVGLCDKDSVIELYADAGGAGLTAFATVGGMLTGFVATNKTEKALTCEDCSKIARFVNICDAYSIPVVTVIDTVGFDDTACIKAITKLVSCYTGATTRKVTLITGKAYGTALSVFISGNADAVFAYDTAVIAPIAPLTAAEFLHHDKLKGASDVAAKRLEIASNYALEMSAANASADGIITAIVTPETAYKTIAGVLEITEGKRVQGRFDRKHGV